jgi:protein ImuB
MGQAPAPPDGPGPLVLVAREGNAMRLSAVDSVAERQGLNIGMTLADARARCPTLRSLPADPAADAQELERLSALMERFTPMVALDPPDGLLLDISGCAHLFGGERQLADRAVALAGYTSRPALSDNAAAARALARHGGTGSELTSLPITVLDLSADALAGLRRAGLRTLADLSARPMASIAARFGEVAVMRLRQIMGDIPSPIVPRAPVIPVRAAARFAEPIARTDDVIEVVEDLLRRVQQDMEQRRLGGRRFDVSLLRSDGVRRDLSIETGQPVRDPAIVLRLLRERIDTLADPIDPGFGFDAIRLAVPVTQPLDAGQRMLEGGAEEARDSIAALIDRLSVRLGPDAIRHIVPCDRHLPERAQAMVPTGYCNSAAWPAERDPLPRPLYLFDPPQRVDVIAGVPDGPPQRFRWRGRLHEVCLAEGPERIAAEWWRRLGGHHAGGAGRTRDYYRIEDSDGRRYWMFRHGLFGEHPAIDWYLHGLFP